MKLPNEFPFSPSEQKNQIQKYGVRRDAYKRSGFNSDCMDINNVRVWTIHHPLTTQDEDYRTNIDKGYTILGWNIRQQLVALVQMQTSKNQHTTGKRIRTVQRIRANTLFLQLKYSFDHIWNCDETWIQAGRQSRVRVLAKRGSNVVYSTTPKILGMVNCRLYS